MRSLQQRWQHLAPHLIPLRWICKGHPDEGAQRLCCCLLAYVAERPSSCCRTLALSQCGLRLAASAAVSDNCCLLGKDDIRIVWWNCFRHAPLSVPPSSSASSAGTAPAGPMAARADASPSGPARMPSCRAVNSCRCAALRLVSPRGRVHATSSFMSPVVQKGQQIESQKDDCVRCRDQRWRLAVVMT